MSMKKCLSLFVVFLLLASVFGATFNYALGNEQEEYYDLTVHTMGGGDVEIEPDQEKYEEGAEVTLTAMPYENREFSFWQRDYPENKTTEKEITITMNEDKEIIANFEHQEEEEWLPFVPDQDRAEIEIHTSLEEDTEAEVTLTFRHSGFRMADWNEVDRTEDKFLVDAEIERSTKTTQPIVTTFENMYDLGTLSPGRYEFIFKSHNVSVDSTEFSVGTYNLTIKEMEGEGNIYANEEAIEEFPYEQEYGKGSVITLEAVPVENFEFDYWEVNGDTYGEKLIDITMEEDKEITAVFEEEVDDNDIPGFTSTLLLLASFIAVAVYHKKW